MVPVVITTVTAPFQASLVVKAWQRDVKIGEELSVGFIVCAFLIMGAHLLTVVDWLFITGSTIYLLLKIYLATFCRFV